MIALSLTNHFSMRFKRTFARRLWHLLAACASYGALAAAAQSLPPEVEAALQRSGIARDAVSIQVSEVQSRASPRLAHRAAVPVNPASVMKLVTTYAALDLLGPTFTWTTPVYIDGTVRNGILNGNLVIKGQGDPKLVSERLWLLMRRVQGLGIKTIHGDIVLDRSAFENLETDPSLFDGEPLRPYNAAPDALLLNFKALVITFAPDRANNLAQVQVEPTLAGVQIATTVPLSAGPCNDYRASLKADFTDPLSIRFNGSYPASCGERVWPIAYAEPKAFAMRAVEGMWRELGGKLVGVVREGKYEAPGNKPAFDVSSPALAEIIRDINKYSNNVMAQQLFLTLSLNSRTASNPATGQGTLAASRDVVQRWWRSQIGDADVPVLDNGSGLSRTERLTAQGLTRMLQIAYASPLMPELMSSLPITGIDGTLRNSRSKARGTAHLKTGTLRDVAAIAGYVLGQSGRRYTVVMIVNQPGAAAARPAMDALIDWVSADK